MSGVRISKKHGLNPTMPVCFWCGEETGEIALMGEMIDENGEEIEAPMHAVVDYTPCVRCQEKMNAAFTLIEVTTTPNTRNQPPIAEGAYPTGNFAVIRMEAAARIFNLHDDKMNKAFCEPGVLQQIGAI